MATEIYVDATFKSVGKPFTQMWSIHVFIQHNGKLKQVPAGFVIMSGAKTIDYEAVLRRLQNIVPLRITSVLMDFEAAAWKAFRNVFPGINVHHFFRRLFALAYLPAEYIAPIFDTVFNTHANINQRIQNVLDYFRTNWIESAVHPPATWSQFNRAIRDNNHQEGWHHRTNVKVLKNHLQLYPIIHHLASEARRLPRIAVLLDDGKVHHHQRKSSTKIQKQLFEGFDKMISGYFSAKQLLAHVHAVYDPYVDPEPAPAGAAAEAE